MVMFQLATPTWHRRFTKTMVVVLSTLSLRIVVFAAVAFSATRSISLLPYFSYYDDTATQQQQPRQKKNDLDHHHHPSRSSVSAAFVNNEPRTTTGGGKQQPPTVLLVYGGDTAAGFATNYYTYVINFCLYAHHRHMDLSVEYNDKYNTKYYNKSLGSNSFEYFFEPIQPPSYSSFSTTDNNDDNNENNFSNNANNRTVVVFPYDKLSEIHSINSQNETFVQAWYYSDLTHKNFNFHSYNEEWYYQNRVLGSQVVAQHIHPLPKITNEANAIWSNNVIGNNNQKKVIVTLGIHMRGTDKGGIGRHKVTPDAYMPYIFNYLQYYFDRNNNNAKGSAVLQPRIYLATDDTNYIRYIEKYWDYYNHSNLFDAPTTMTTGTKRSISMKFSDIVTTQQGVARSKFRKAVFSRTDISRYESGKQTLLDILLLSKCDYFVHSASAVAEAVHWNNILLHNQSVHMEYQYGRQEPIWYNSSRYQDWPSYESIIYEKPTDCPASKFPIHLNNIACSDMFSIHARDMSMCREACCADNECNTFLWCINKTVGGPYCRRASCWIGTTAVTNTNQATNKEQCYDQNGWIGGTTTVMQHEIALRQ